MDKKTKAQVSAMAALGLSMNNKQKEQVLKIAKKAVAEEIYDEVYQICMEEMKREICKEPEKYKPVLDAAMDLVRPLVQSEWMGFGIQCTLDAFLLALREMGWRSTRAMRLVADAGEWMNKMSDQIMQEHMEALRYDSETTEPICSKAFIDDALREMYGPENFQPWDDRYKTASEATQESCNDAFEKKQKMIREKNCEG